MLTGRVILFWTLVVAGIILIVAPDLPSPSFLPDYPPMQCEKYGRDHNQYCAALEVFRVGIARLGDFFSGYESLFLIALTGVIAYFTFALKDATVELKQSTDRLWEAGDRQLRQTQRAFVYLKEWDINVIRDAGGSPKSWKITPIWKNSGFTPAVGLTTNINWTMSLFAHPEIGEYIYNKPADVLVLGPKAIGGSRSIDIPAEEIYPLREGLGAVYIWGRADYMDAFQATRPHFAEYCARVDIEVGHDPTKPYVALVYVGPHNRTDDGQT